MSRLARLALVALISVFLVGCKTSEIKNQVDPSGLADDIPTGTIQSGYGDGKGDSLGGGGAAPPLDAKDAVSPHKEVVSEEKR